METIQAHLLNPGREKGAQNHPYCLALFPKPGALVINHKIRALGN